MIQAEYGYSDEEITLQIQESPYLQYFCGYEAYDDSKPPFDSSSMVYFRKRLTPEILGDINEMILSRNKTEEHTTDPAQAKKWSELSLENAAANSFYPVDDDEAENMFNAI